MKRFAFRLQTVLDVAKRAEDEVRKRAAAKLADLRDAEEALQTCLDMHESAERDIEKKLAERRLDVEGIRVHQDFAGTLLGRSRVLRGRVRATETAYSAAQRALIEKRRDVVVLERSRDNAMEEWRASFEKAEREQIDESVAARWLDKLEV